MEFTSVDLEEEKPRPPRAISVNNPPNPLALRRGSVKPALAKTTSNEALVAKEDVNSNELNEFADISLSSDVDTRPPRTLSINAGRNVSPNPLAIRRGSTKPPNNTTQLHITELKSFASADELQSVHDIPIVTDDYEEKPRPPRAFSIAGGAAAGNNPLARRGSSIRAAPTVPPSPEHKSPVLPFPPPLPPSPSPALPLSPAPAPAPTFAPPPVPVSAPTAITSAPQSPGPLPPPPPPPPLSSLEHEDEIRSSMSLSFSGLYPTRPSMIETEYVADRPDSPVARMPVIHESEDVSGMYESEDYDGLYESRPSTIHDERPQEAPPPVPLSIPPPVPQSPSTPPPASPVSPVSPTSSTSGLSVPTTPPPPVPMLHPLNTVRLSDDYDEPLSDRTTVKPTPNTNPSGSSSPVKRLSSKLSFTLGSSSPHSSKHDLEDIDISAETAVKNKAVSPHHNNNINNNYNNNNSNSTRQPSPPLAIIPLIYKDSTRPLPDIEIQGMGWKQCPSVVIVWQERYFAMKKDGTIHYFADKDAFMNNYAPKGVIVLSDVQKGGKNGAMVELSGNKLNIGVHSKNGRVYRLKFGTTEEASKWNDATMKYVNQLRKK